MRWLILLGCVSWMACGEGMETGGQEQACAPGATLRDGICISTAELTCGEGTTLQGDRCIASGTPVLCGTNTTLNDGTCEVDLGAVCGAATEVDSAGQCVGTAAVATCGTGTRLVNGACELDPATACGAGAVYQNGRCEAGAVVTTSLDAFIERDDLKLAYSNQTSGLRAMVTTVSQSAARDWSDVLGTPVGTGLALHLATSESTFFYGTNKELVLPVRNLSDATGSGCSPYATPHETSSGRMTVTVYSWDKGLGTPRACATAGSVRFTQTCVVTGCSVSAVLNVAFTDGTVWQDKVLSFPER